MCRASTAWEDLVYNFARPLGALRLRIFDDTLCCWRPRVSAMAAKLMGHVWTAKELLAIVVLPNNTY